MNQDQLAIFDNPAFGVRSLSTAINIVPNKDSIWNSMGLFKSEFLYGTNFSIEYKNGVINLVPSAVRGAPGAKNRTGKRHIRSFEIPHFPIEDGLLADAIQNKRKFGSDDQLEVVEEIVNERLDTMADKLDVTREWLRNGAVHGLIQDADGSTMFDLFTEFGVTEEVFDFDFSGSPNIEKTAAEIKRYYRKIKKGETVTGVVVLGSVGFMDKVMQDAETREAYRFFNNAQGKNPNRDSMRDNFTHYGLTFVEYDGTVDYYNPLTDTTTTYDYLADGEARIIPLGTKQVFTENFAPADYMETVNTKAQERYAKQEPMRFGKGIDMEAQMNVLPMVSRPEFLVKAK